MSETDASPTQKVFLVELHAGYPGARKFLGTIRQGKHVEDLPLIYKMLIYKEAHKVKDAIKEQAWHLARHVFTVEQIVFATSDLLQSIISQRNINTTRNYDSDLGTVLAEADRLVAGEQKLGYPALRKEGYWGDDKYEQYSISLDFALLVEPATKGRQQ